MNRAQVSLTLCVIILAEEDFMYVMKLFKFISTNKEVFRLQNQNACYQMLKSALQVGI